MADSAYRTVRAGKLRLKGTKSSRKEQESRKDADDGPHKPRDEDRLTRAAVTEDDGDKPRAAEDTTEEWRPMTEEEARRIVDAIPGLTPTQKRLEVLRIKQEHLLNKDKVASSHRDKVKKMNENLASLPMHFDIPRVAAAGLG
jgi:hypothetical protein